MTQIVKKGISEEVNNSVFFSLSSDGNNDITLYGQTSIVLRYVTLAAEEAVVKEHLVSMVETGTTTGEGKSEKIKDEIKSVNVDIKKCIGMSFDGASNMQGINKGVITHLKQCSSMATNIYCGSHGTNLVMKVCAKSSVVSIHFFGTENKPGNVQKLKTFLYGNSRKRNNIFEKCKSLLKDANQSIELAATKSVRFSALQNATNQLLTLYQAVINCLEQISNDMELKMYIRSEGLLSRFQSYETIVTLCLFKEIFTILGPLNIILQGETLDFLFAIMSVDVSLEKLQVSRDSADQNVILSAVKVATEAQLEQQIFVKNRTRRKKRLDFDETEVE
ncbi:zinc finger MYM-type protein 6-like [Hydra vulgaris]|uniref:Zinc finger MYM-type protein 6-like n=1 Tax=Hydra vulgaris TaxID=6087 RepID=A0ABM4BZS0_HYDVU